MKINLEASPDFRFIASNDSGYRFEIGASKAIGGDDSGFRPMQLVLAALGSCSGIDVISILKKSRVEFSRIQVEVEGHRVDAVPSPFDAVHLSFRIHGPAVEGRKAQKAIALAVEKYCSVAEMLKQTVKISHSMEIIPEP